MVASPAPGVAQPERRDDVQPGRRRAGVPGADRNAQVLGIGLGDVHGHFPPPGPVEDAGVEQLVLRIEP